MSHKRSACVTQRKKKIWMKNLVQFQDSYRKRRHVPLEEHSLDTNETSNCQSLPVPWRYHQRKERKKKGNFERSNIFMAKKITFLIFINSKCISKRRKSAEYLQ
uniref:Uncharacterized protein n=1 Tax=Octopus bimaculoides TaxID=37653 RepID=A0A0L8HZW2_OCTBM